MYINYQDVLADTYKYVSTDTLERIIKLMHKNKKHVKLIGVKGNNDISKFLLKNINCNFQSELSEIKRQKDRIADKRKG